MCPPCSDGLLHNVRPRLIEELSNPLAHVRLLSSKLLLRTGWQESAIMNLCHSLVELPPKYELEKTFLHSLEKLLQQIQSSQHEVGLLEAVLNISVGLLHVKLSSIWPK